MQLFTQILNYSLNTNF